MCFCRRLVPLSFFVIVPMMEFALPFALRLFPNLLPSTFEEKHHREEKRVKLLKVRLEMAQLLEHTLEERAAQVRRRGGAAGGETANTTRPCAACVVAALAPWP